jgi:hypothetical protein
VPAPAEPVRVRLHLISATFHGRVKNVCPFVDECGGSGFLDSGIS